MQFAAEKVIPATLIAGDGIGPKIVDAAKDILDDARDWNGNPVPRLCHLGKATTTRQEEYGRNRLRQARFPRTITTTTCRAAPLIEMCVIESELNENISLPDPSRVRALRFGSYGI
jgi:hypothetical protein